MMSSFCSKARVAGWILAGGHLWATDSVHFSGVFQTSMIDLFPKIVDTF